MFPNTLSNKYILVEKAGNNTAIFANIKILH